MISLILVLSLGGCAERPPYAGGFDQPSALAVIQPEQGGPFSEPIGYVANADNGQIAVLALKQGRFLTDDPHGSFIRSSPLATGGARRLTALATYVPAPDQIVVFAGDTEFDQLLRIPHVVSVDENGVPTESEPKAGEAAFLDVDGSGDTAAIADLRVRSGFTTTESWSVSYDGKQWWVVGSRSGKQELPAYTDEFYSSDLGRVDFTITGTATTGDRFEFTTDSGLTETDIGGAPLGLAMKADQSVLAAVVQVDTEHNKLVWVDPATAMITAGPELPADARPMRVAWDGDTAWVADGATIDGGGRIFEITGDTVATHVVPWPVLDVAPLTNANGTTLYIAPVNVNQIWLLRTGTTDEWVDINTWVEGIQGLETYSPVTGLDAITRDYRWAETDPSGVALYGRSVAASLATGRVVFLEEDTGCLTRDSLGPTTEASTQLSNLDYDTNFSTDDGNEPSLELNGASNRHIRVNPCAGVARAETWTLTFDAVQQAWQVEGSLSGLQPTMAREDERYISPNGAVSFLIRAGGRPSLDGNYIRFATTEGFLSVEGDNNVDDVREIELDLPIEPVYFHYLAGKTSGGWSGQIDHAYVLIAASASDRVVRGEPGTGEYDADWR